MPEIPGDRLRFQLPPRGEAADDQLVEVIDQTWKAYEGVRRPWTRQVEENVRMLSGRQFDVWIETLGEFVDLSSWFIPSDDRWRRNPVFNWVGNHWYTLALAKLTENIPVLSALPSTSDLRDAKLATIFDRVFKYYWGEMRMPESMFHAYGWLLTSGRFVLKMRWDPTKGPSEFFTAPADLQLQTPFGEPYERQLTDAPYTQQEDGEFGPNMQTDANGNVIIDPESMDPLMGDPYRFRQGDLITESIAPTSLLIPWGPNPRWLMHEYLLPVDEVESRFDVKVEPEALTNQDDLLLKMEYGTHYGMPTDVSSFSASTIDADKIVTEGLVRIRERWQYDSPTDPYGRLTIVTRTDMLYDEINPYVVEGEQNDPILPFYWFDKPGYPFRQEGTSDLEAMNPIQRAMNRRIGGLMDSVDYAEQPIRMIDRNQVGDDQDDKFNIAGSNIYFDQVGAQPPAFYLDPPKLPSNGIDMAEYLKQFLGDLGHSGITGAGQAVTDEASGQLQREVRFDADRPWGATLRLHSYVWARLGKDMMKLLGVCITDDRMLAIAGEDNAALFLEVSRDLFSGSINVTPSPESAVIESRADKEARVKELITMQVVDPIQAAKILDMPDVTRALRPGGEAYSMAIRENAEMATSLIPSPVIPEHDHAVHMEQHLQFMQTVDFRDANPQLHMAFRVHIMLHQTVIQQQQAQMVQQMADTHQMASEAAGGAVKDPLESGETAGEGPPSPSVSEPGPGGLEMVG